MNRESKVRSLKDLEDKLGEVVFPFDDVVPEQVKEWFNVFSTSHRTTQELLLTSALSSTSALIDKTTLGLQHL